MRSRSQREIEVVEGLVVGAVFLFLLWLGFRWQPLIPYLETHNKLFSSLQMIITGSAVALGAWWFTARRQRYPRANITNTVTHRIIAPGYVWVHIRTDITNTGNVLLEIVNALTWLQKIVPAPVVYRDQIIQGLTPAGPNCTEIQWPTIDDRQCDVATEIEPGESDFLAWDFIIPDEHKTIRVFTAIHNETKRARGPIGWSTETIYDIVGDDPDHEGTSSKEAGMSTSDKDRTIERPPQQNPDEQRQSYIPPRPDRDLQEQRTIPERPPRDAPPKK
jgi:hypothetical protein